MNNPIAISAALVSTLFAGLALAEEPAAADAPAAEEATAAESSGDAKASPQAEQGPISVAALIGNGFEDGYNIGFGVRGGYTIDHGIYAGGTFIYHLGTSSGPAEVNIMLIGAEGGYSLDAGPMIVRPYLGLGLASISATVDMGPFGKVDASDSKIYFAPGVTGLYPIGSMFVGADARFTIVSSNNALGLFLTAGTTF
jgi:hypothetical protein